MTTYNQQSHANIGDLYTASMYNTGLDNDHAFWTNAASGALPFWSAANLVAALLKPTVQSLLTHDGTVPSWLNKAASLGLLTTNAAGVLAWLTGGVAYDVLRKNSANNGLEWAGLGRITIATRSSNLTYTRSASVPINWNSELIDDDNQHDNSTNPSRITIASTGIYIVVLFASMTITNGDWAIFSYLKKNGVEFGGNPGWGGNGGGAVRPVGCAGIVQATAGEYIEGFVDWNGTGATTTIDTKSVLAVIKIR